MSGAAEAVSDGVVVLAGADQEEVQNGRTSDLIFSVPALIEGLSKMVTMLPGDVIFTGTPAGVDLGGNPERLIQPGETLISRIEGIGEITQTFIPHASERNARRAETPTTDTKE